MRIRKQTQIYRWFVCVAIILAGCTERQTTRNLEIAYVVSNEVHCVVRDDLRNVRKQYGIEGVRERSELVQQTVSVWRFPLGSGQTKPVVNKTRVGALRTQDENSVETVLNTSLIVRRWQERGPVLRHHVAVWSSRSKQDLAIDFNRVIAFDRTREHAVLPWQDGVAVVKLASLPTDKPAVVPKPYWSSALRFLEYSYHHAHLTRDGTRLVFFPEGGSRLCCHVLVLGSEETKRIELPPTLAWNDVIDAEVVDGQLFFITRNHGSHGDSHQITDSSWNILANLPGEEGWFRPTWDVDGRRLVFREFVPFAQPARGAVRFRVWDYSVDREFRMAIQ